MSLRLLRCGAVMGPMLCACAPYTPRPLDPSAHPAAYRARRLDNPALLTYVAKYAGTPAQGRWTDRQLAVAALRLRPEIARARAEWRTAVAAERSAAARPQPGAQADVERAVSGSGGNSPWVISLASLFTLELGGKRGARLQAARARTAVAASNVVLQSWRTVGEVRAASALVAAAEAALASAREEADVLDRVQALEAQRFAEAALPSSELARTAGDLQAARAAVASTERAAGTSRAQLAATLAMPSSALDSVSVGASAEDAACDWLDRLGLDSLSAVALTRRGEVARALASYAEAEAELRLQVARQYPDLDLGPGFIWDQGVHRWTLALALPQLLAFRNRAPIREAEAARSAAAARVVEAQDSVLAELGIAAHACRGARRERAAADSLVSTAERSAALARAAYERGESSRLEPAQGELGLIRARRLLMEAERAVVEAGLALSAATGEWDGGRGIRWPDPRQDPDSSGAGP